MNWEIPDVPGEEIVKKISELERSEVEINVEEEE